MKKTIILIIAIGIVLLTFISYKIYYHKNLLNAAKEENAQYEKFYNVDALGIEIATLINKIEDSNSKNNVEKDTKGKYISNNNNSIQAEIQFLELEETIPIEKIGKQGINQFVQIFGGMQFRCTKIEYHQRTGKIKYMYFEQVEN